MSVGAAETRTGFSGTSIPLNWQWHGRPGVDWAMPNPADGYLRLNCLAHEEGWRNLWDTPNLLMEKIVGPSMEFTAELVFRPSYEGDRVGLVVMGLDYSTLELYFDGQQVTLQRRACADADSGTPERVTDALPLDPVLSESDKPYCTVYLRENIHERAAGTAKGASRPQQEIWPPVVECDFSYSLDGRRFRPLGAAFTAREGKWIGAKAGFFATADVRKNDGGSVEIR